MAIFNNFHTRTVNFLFYSCLLICSGSAFSAETKLLTPYEHRKVLQQLSNQRLLNSTYETTALTPQGQQVTRYTTRPTLLSKSSLGKMAKGALTGPVGIALTAALIAADYFIDDNGDIAIGTPAYSGLGSCGNESNVTISYCLSQAEATWPGVTINPTLQSNRVAFIADHHFYNIWGYWYPNAGVPLPSESEIGGSTSVVTDEQVGETVDSFDSDLIADILNDSSKSGRWPQEWPEAQQIADAISDTLGEVLEGVPAQNPDQTIIDSSTSTNTVTNNEFDIELPPYCEYAQVVCDFLDWFQGDSELPAPIDVPETDIDVDTDSFDSGIAVGVCPADDELTLATFGVTIPISWSYVCELAISIRPVVIGFSWLMGVFILIRVR